MLRKVKHLLEFWLVLDLMVFVNVLPQAAAAAFGRAVGRVGYKLWGSRRRIAKANLRFCFPDKDNGWVAATAKKSFEVFGQMIVEHMRFLKYSERNIREWVSIENEKCFFDAEAAGRGALLITGHYGSYEMGGAAVGLYGHRMTFLVGTQSNRYVDAMMNWARRRAGLGIIHMGTPALKAVLKELRSGGTVALVSDQDAGDDGVVVEFFGHPASTPRGPAVFALKTGAAFCCGYAVHDGGPRHTLFMEDVVFPGPRDGSNEEDVKYWTGLYMSYLENWCRRHPGMYLWMHRRFKSTVPEVYENLYD